LYRPAGNGPFPLVIYNHGSRPNGERNSLPFRYIGALFARAGYVVLVPERRGYGRPRRPTPAQGIRRRIGPRLGAAPKAETDDVLAALDHAATIPGVDLRRTAIVGWSLGGIITILTLARSAAFRCGIAQAGGALTWDRSAAVRAALTTAARGAQAPMLMMIA